MGIMKITQVILIKEVCNEMCHNYYYLVHAKVWNEQKISYFNIKFIVWFDIFDALEYYEKERINKKELRRYALMNAYHFVFNHQSKQEIVNCANKTLDDYNKKRI